MNNANTDVENIIARIAILEGEGFFTEIHRIAHENNCSYVAAWELLEDERKALNLRPRFSAVNSLYNAFAKRRYKRE